MTFNMYIAILFLHISHNSHHVYILVLKTVYLAMWFPRMGINVIQYIEKQDAWFDIKTFILINHEFSFLLLYFYLCILFYVTKYVTFFYYIWHHYILLRFILFDNIYLCLLEFYYVWQWVNILQYLIYFTVVLHFIMLFMSSKQRETLYHHWHKLTFCGYVGCKVFVFN